MILSLFFRIHGNRSVKRNLENIPEQLPLTENLKNSNYVKIVFEDESKIARRFSKVDVGEIRKMLAKQHSKKQLLGTRKTKRFIRQPKFKDQLDQLFLLLRVKKQQIQPSFVITAGILLIIDLKFNNNNEKIGSDLGCYVQA